MKKLLIVLGLLALIVSVGTAQPAPGMHNGLWVGLFNQSAGVNHVLQLDAKNNPKAFTTTPNSPWPYWGNPFGACMYWDNKHIVVPAILDNPAANIGIALWDATLPGAAALIWKGPITGGQLGNWADFSMDSDGNIVTVDNSTAPQTVHFFSTGGKWTKMNLPATTRTSGGILGTKWDRINGGWIWGAWGPPTELYQSSYDFSTTKTLATGPLTTNIGRYGGDLTEDGNFYSSTCCSQKYYVVKKGQNTFTPGPAAALDVNYDITAEHYAKAGTGFWGVIYNAPYGVQHTDPLTTPPTVTKVFTGSAATMPVSPLEVVELYTNDLNTSRTGARTWDINISPGGGMWGSKNYIIAASLTGAAKIPVAGRELFISPDVLTLATIAGPFPPFLTGNVGALDPFGNAKAKLNLQALGLAANGNVLHFAGVVLDPAAPGGIAHVFQPWAFVINNM
jgi:hypothetical protein